jgi:hypothetical protein
LDGGVDDSDGSPSPAFDVSKLSLFELSLKGVENLALGFGDDVLQLPFGLSSFERSQLHKVAERLGLTSHSEGDGEYRRMVLGRVSNSPEVQQFNHDFDPDWASCRVKYDLKHFLGLAFAMARSASILYGLFCSSLADCIIKPLDGERERVKRHFVAKGMSEADIGRLPRKSFRCRMRHTIPHPARVYEDVRRCVLFFSRLDDPTTGNPFFLSGWQDILDGLLRSIAKGWLSDPPGVCLYVKVKVLETGFVVYRCGQLGP